MLFSMADSCQCMAKPTTEWLPSKSLQTINAGEGVEKREPSYTVGGNANQYSHYGEQCGDSLENWKQNCHRTQQSHYWAHTPRKPQLKEARVPSVHHSTVHNRQDTEATQMSIGRRMAREIVVHIRSGMLLRHKKEHI